MIKARKNHNDYQHSGSNAMNKDAFSKDGVTKLKKVEATVSKTLPFGNNMNVSLISGIDSSKVVYRDRVESMYHPRTYQYATTSHEKVTMQPFAIISPTSIEDVQKVVHYARESKLAVAVRTGGHAYNGCSSTSGRNIQLDLKDTFKEFEYNERNRLVRCGVSLSLLEFSQQMALKKMFLPTGQCAHVHLGGHIQTGGYGQSGRAHGLLCDYVESIELVTADGKPRTLFSPTVTANKSTEYGGKKDNKLENRN